MPAMADTPSTTVPTEAEHPSLRVLVVEDDPDALSATLALLEAMGHWAVGVPSSEAAISRFVEQAFDVLMVDMILPTVSGVELVQDLLRRERLPVIFASGEPRHARSPEGAVWLRKPYSLAQLESALEDCRRAAKQ